MDAQQLAQSPLAVGVQAGLLALYPIGRAPRVLRIAYVAVPAAIGAVAVSVWPSGDEGRAARTAGAVGAAAALASTQLAILRLDRTTERLVRRLNLPAPRVVVALGAGVANAALSMMINRWLAARR